VLGITDIYQRMINEIKNQVLKKLVKLANSQNVNIYRYINVSNTSWLPPWGVFFMIFVKVATKIATILPPFNL